MALRIGLTISEYNEITPHELTLYVQAFNERMDYQSKEHMTMAYLVAYWSRSKKMPSLNSVLGNQTNAEKKEQSNEQMLKTIRQLNAAMGGKEVKKNVCS